MLLLCLFALITINAIVYADERCIPEWETFFEKFSQMTNDDNPRHESVLVEVLKYLGQPTQLPVEYPEQVALYEADFVEPVMLRGFTDAATAAERQELLNLRAANANLLRLKGKLIFFLCYYS